MQVILETLQEEFRVSLELTEKSTPRSYKFPEAKNIIKVAVGMRRSGKTYFLFQTVREFLAEELVYIGCSILISRMTGFYLLIIGKLDNSLILGTLFVLKTMTVVVISF